MTDESTKLLRIYLNDHYFGANAGVALARRIAKAHRDTLCSANLASLADEIARDLETLTALMKRLDVAPQQWRAPAGKAAERAGRLKLNGRLLSRSPLSNVVELEGLLGGIDGKRALWRTLRRLADVNDQLDAAALDDLIERSWRQSDVVEGIRKSMIEGAFIAPPD
jgi:hypothetical protein